MIHSGLSRPTALQQRPRLRPLACASSQTILPLGPPAERTVTAANTYPSSLRIATNTYNTHAENLKTHNKTHFCCCGLHTPLYLCQSALDPRPEPRSLCVDTMTVFHDLNLKRNHGASSGCGSITWPSPLSPPLHDSPKIPFPPANRTLERKKGLPGSLETPRVQLTNRLSLPPHPLLVNPPAKVSVFA